LSPSIVITDEKDIKTPTLMTWPSELGPAAHKLSLDWKGILPVIEMTERIPD
jgi:hypothetical protein